MSLQVWLPLNGDLHNQGLSRINLTTTPTFSTPGKISQSCLNSQVGWFAVPEMVGKKQMSFAYWVKLNSGTTTNWLDPFSWYSTDGSTNHRSRQEFYYYNTNGNTEAMTTGVWYYNQSNSGLTQRKIGQWYHYAFTINYATGITQFFIDGQLWKTTTNADTTHYVKGDGNAFLLRESALDCQINDFRLYDHILSAKEIEEISKGLALHIKLNNVNFSSDSSGYNHQLIWANASNTTDTARYDKSTTLTGSSSYVKVTDNTWMAQHAREMTLNVWAKATTWPTSGRIFSCTESGGFNTEAGNSGYWRFPIYVCTNEAQTSYAYKYDSSEIQISALPTSQWVMLTFVYDSTGTKTYINGVLHHTYTNASYGIRFNTNARLFLGCEANTANPTSPYFNGQLSDFRIYYTVLSEEQIFELYHTSATIDKNGNVYTREYIENDNLNITKTGVFGVSNVYDDNDLTIASIVKTSQQVQGNTIYEY